MNLTSITLTIRFVKSTLHIKYFLIGISLKTRYAYLKTSALNRTIDMMEIHTKYVTSFTNSRFNCNFNKLIVSNRVTITVIYISSLIAFLPSSFIWRTIWFEFKLYRLPWIRYFDRLSWILHHSGIIRNFVRDKTAFLLVLYSFGLIFGSISAAVHKLREQIL